MKSFVAVVFCMLASTAHAAPIMLVDFANQPVDFASVQKEVTLLAFWSSACVPCIEEMPLLDALYAKVKSDPSVAIFGINVDESDNDIKAAQKVMAANPVAYPMLRDDKRALASTWIKDPKFMALPTLLVVDRAMHAQLITGFKSGVTPERFIAARLQQIADARAGKFHKHVTKIADKAGGAKQSKEQMATMIEKMIRNHHPELDDAAVKKRVDAAMQQIAKGGNVSID